jgi:type II secretory pathway predicted ATPase ExeA
LNAPGTLSYLRHRLTVAGAPRFLFDERAALLLHQASGGLPRVLNQLATEALIEGMARGVAEVGAEVVEAVIQGRDFLDKPVLHQAV